MLTAPSTTSMTSTTTAAVHDGDFHADDCLALALAERVFGPLTVFRTRDPSVISSSKIVMDVGTVYDRQTLRFDHHQNGFTERFDGSTVLMASVGLFWRDFGQQILRTELPEATDEQITFAHRFIYFGFFQAIDGGDNGVDEVDGGVRAFKHGTTLAARVNHLNYIGTFAQACQLCKDEFTDYLQYFKLRKLNQLAPTRLAFEKRFEVHPSGKVLRMSEADLDIISIIEKELGCEILFTTTVRKNGDFCIKAINVEGSFKCKLPLPEKWRGLSNDELSAASGINGGVFVHKGGFLGVWKSQEAIDQVVCMLLKQ